MLRKFNYKQSPSESVRLFKGRVVPDLPDTPTDLSWMTGPAAQHNDCGFGGGKWCFGIMCSSCILAQKNWQKRKEFYERYTVPVPEKDEQEGEQEGEQTEMLNEAQKCIAAKCDELKQLLTEKNKKYGNSALNPVRIFSKADDLEQLRVRMDDKLNRIKNRAADEDEDVVKDLAGYCILYMIKQDELKGKE